MPISVYLSAIIIAANMQKMLPFLIGLVLCANAVVFVSGDAPFHEENNEGALDELAGRQAWAW